MKLCSDCNETLPKTFFYKGSKRCKACQNAKSIAWTKDNPEQHALIRRRNKLKKKYGITLEEYDAMFEACNGVCQICKQPSIRRPLNVDHCHDTGKVRGLLCDKCNMALGLFDDNVNLLQGAINYL